MKICKLFLVLVVGFLPLFSYAQGSSKGFEKFEMSFQIGAGFTWSNPSPVDGVTRVPDFAWAPGKASKFPAFEAYGAVLRYGIDERWAVQLQGMRQRLRFEELSGNETHAYYNAAWHVDAMAEFNLLNYAFLSTQKSKVYELVPFISFGAGASFYGANATYSYGSSTGIVDGKEKNICLNSRERGHEYPMIKNTKAAMYIPFAVGTKLRMTANWQLKLACQYNFYLFGSDGQVDFYGATMRPVSGAEYVFIEGETGYTNKKSGTKHYYINGEYRDGGVTKEIDVEMQNIVKYDDIPEYKGANFGKTHNLMLTLGVIFNFNAAYKDMIIE